MEQWNSGTLEHWNTGTLEQLERLEQLISCNDHSKTNMNFVSSEVKFGKFVIFSYLLQLDYCLIFEEGLAKNDENYVVHGRYHLFMDQNGELFPWNIYLWRIIPLRVPM